MSRDGMPKSSATERKLAHPYGDVVVVQGYYAVAGRPYADVWDPDTGQQWKGVPVLGSGGGEAAYAHVPLQTGERSPTQLTKRSPATQSFVVFRGEARRPVALGALHHPSVDMLPEAIDTLVADADPAVPSIRDVHLKFGGTTILVRPSGRVVLELEDGADLMAQFGGSGGLRLPSDGEAQERFPLAGELAAYLSTLVAAINEIGTALAALTITLDGAAGQPNNPPVEVYTPTGVSNPTDAIKSATVHVSSKTEADPV